MVKLDKYQKYKNSGIAWIGEIPEHWDVSKLGYFATIKARLGWKGLTAKEYVEQGYIFLATPNIKENEIDFTNVNYINDKRYFESPEIMLKHDDVLLVKDGSTLGIVNIVKELPSPSTVNSSIAVIRSEKKMCSNFLFRWLTGNYIQSIIDLMKNGQGVPHLFQADIRKFILLVPPLSEQKAIAAYLDRKTAEIDELIAQKERLIELYEEEKTAIINEAVTRGIDPNVKLKPSGIDWLGDIPEHWEYSKLKFETTKIVDGTHFTPTYVSQGIPFLRVTDIQSRTIDLDRVKRISQEAHQELIKRCNPQKGDVLLSKNGTIGITKVIDWDWRFSIFVSLCLLKFKGRLLNIYFSYFFKSNVVVQQITESSQTTSVTNLHLEKIKELIICLPPLSDQKAIVEHIDKECDRIDKKIAKTQRIIELQKEYRTALISEAVTGKIKVPKLIS